METLKQKIAIVTGGSGGIGAAVCQKLASQGAKITSHVFQAGGGYV